MKGLRSIIVVATIIAAAVVLNACEKGYKDEPEAVGVTFEHSAR
jgi:ABC-type transporter Mla maintaining outer membrane lipid asymmetry permease subunit MlaE